MTKTHVKQHTVPACYLKAWMDPTCRHDDRFVWLFDKDGRNPRAEYPKSLFTREDFYTHLGPSGERNLHLEEGLGKLESQFTRIRTSKLNYRRAIAADERVYLCGFVAAAQFRTVSSHDHHSAQWKRIADLGDQMIESTGRATDAQRARAGALAPPPSRSQTLSHDQVKELAAHPIQSMFGAVVAAQLPVLSSMRLSILCTADPVGFITSDTPCHWYDPQAHKRPPLFRAHAIGSPTIEITMPLSPQQLLLLTHNGFDGYIDISSDVTHEINRSHRWQCDRNFVVRSNTRIDKWFEEYNLPADAWEYTRCEREDGP